MHDVKKRILFRADAAPDIGTGDLVSFFTLAQRFKAKSWEPWYLVRDTPAARAVTEARDERNVVWLDDGASVAAEVERINAALGELGARALFTQITRHELQPYADVRADMLRCAVVFRQGQPANWDMALCWDVDSRQYFKSSDYDGMRLFLGPEHVILSPDFDAPQRPKRNHPPKRVLVAMGGGDEADLSRRVFERLAELDDSLGIRIVVGGGYRHMDTLRQAVERRAMDCTILQNLPGLLPEYLACDLAIGAGGLTASELAATRTPALLIAAVKHQRDRCAYFQSLGLARYLGQEHDWTMTADDLAFQPAQDAKFRSRIQEAVDWVDQAV